MRAWLLVAAVVLAGCSGGSGKEAPTGSADVEPGDEVLRGWVLDPAVAPIVGATVSVPAENVTVTTNEDGEYAIPRLPADRPLVIVAQADGHLPLSKSLTLRPDEQYLLNFSLQRVPVKQPYDQAVSFNGFLGCSTIIRTETGAQRYDCSSASPQDERAWDFPVNPDLKGLVVEVAWDYGTELARHLNVTVETVGFGNLDEVLASDEGGTVLRVQVPSEKADRFYRQGGIVRVSVDIGRNIDEEEVSAGVGAGVQQDFEVIATAFYVTAPPPAFSAVG